MAELRQNLVTKEWVIISTERAKRPHAYIETANRVITETQALYDANCPFCPGNEELDLGIEHFPPEGPWQTRVVYNKYPALSPDVELSRTFEGVYRRISGVGHHEVVVESPRHNTTLA